jgi:regulator of protease activity HflC (stomatin/prohibitin superfamily)
MTNLQRILAFCFIAILLQSCTIIRQGEVGIKRTLGKVREAPLMQGAKLYFPFTTRIIRIPVNTENIEVKIELPSKEGLNIAADISILYNVKAETAPKLFQEVGINYESTVIIPIFRSAAADVCARFYAKDMHSGERSKIEAEIKKMMIEQLSNRGIVIQSVLMKSIKLPQGLAKAIEDKLEAEQQSQQMQFILDRERQEAERLKIEAVGVRDAQRIITEGLNPMIIQFKSLEVFIDLSNSPNKKIIITDGSCPMLLYQDLTK